MKLSTANSKNANYTEAHEIYIGTHTGSFKRLDVAAENPHVPTNLQQISNLTKDSKVTALGYGNKEETEILVGRANKFVQVYDVSSGDHMSSIELGEAPIVGLCRYAGKLLAGFGTGKVHILGEREPTVLTAGDNMSRMRQCSFNDKLIATGGKERQNNLKIFDLESTKQIFSSKNLPNDFLNLEVPIWDSDVAFLDANRISTCSRYGYIRYYDIRTQRRPVHMFSDDQMSFSCMTVKDPYVYSGTTLGLVKGFDTRNLKNFIHTYKGFTGSVSDLAIDHSGKFLASGSLDRYIRVHHIDNCSMLYQCYIKSKAVRVLIRDSESSRLASDSDNECTLVDTENRNEVEKDEEYEILFDNMPTIKGLDEENCDENLKRKKGMGDGTKSKRQKSRS